MTSTSDSRTVVDTVRSRTGIVLFRHPKTSRVWLIPGMTLFIRDAAVVCYIWATQHRVIDLESPTTAADVSQTQVTAIFRKNSYVDPTGRRSRSRSGRPLVEEENLSSIRHLVDSENIVVHKYVLTRDNRIELLSEPTTAPTDGVKPFLTIEVLRTAPNMYTPMLSP